jgi:hypothetical protein
MAGTDDKPNTTDAAARIDPTRALQRLLPAFTAHAAAARLTTAVQSNECRLWCNGDLLPPQYIATALRLIAISDVDGRWRGEIVSAVREAWEPISYVFVLDEAEVATLLPTAPAKLRSGSLAPADSSPSLPPSPPTPPSATNYRLCRRQGAQGREAEETKGLAF